jgi:hypothetical protein
MTMIRLTALVALILLAGSAEASRVPSRKADGQRTPGARGDITIPYLTNGTSTLGVYNGVGPIIYATPTVNDPRNKGILPVYNLIYYGSKQSVSGSNPGAMPRRPNQLRPDKP